EDATLRMADAIAGMQAVLQDRLTAPEVADKISAHGERGIRAREDCGFFPMQALLVERNRCRRASLSKGDRMQRDAFRRRKRHETAGAVADLSCAAGHRDAAQAQTPGAAFEESLEFA